MPPDAFISCLGKLDETDFLIWFGCNQVLLLSLKASAETSISPFNLNVHNKRITCSTFSPDSLYLVCGYENGVLKILSVDCGKTLQTIKLKQKPLACYWSKPHLWVTCEKGVIKLCKVSTPTTVLDNVLEQTLVEFSVKIRDVLKFEEGVLVFDSFERENNIYISTISDENEQKFKIFYDTGRYVDSVAISSDGRACLLHRKPSKFELWEMDRKNDWHLVSKEVLEVEENYERFWFCLTGAQNFRVMIMLTSDHIFSLNFSINIQTKHKCTLATKFNDYYVSDVIYVAPGILIIREQSWIYFIDVLNGKTISKLYGSLTGAAEAYYLASRGVRLFVEHYDDIRSFTVRNIEKFPPSLFSEKYWQVRLTDSRRKHRHLWYSAVSNSCFDKTLMLKNLSHH